ncbi:MAG: tRNA (guanosine(46)-N7)-methyltransferase TrmB [Gemmataceae bacterium]|nr:tRNA (guanosine(46)-N7)-methyltransferase TrmB [Gemmataceae bacterium]MCI0743630.1 tRNA (guanosine(46)-N7)-methyltransferase TrmB [Gemmataceae bacterium]
MRRGRLPVEALRPYLLEVPAPFQATPDKMRAAEVSPLPHGRGSETSWRDIFGNDLAVEIEVGCGKGLFLVTAGQANPRTNFLGIEKERKYALYTAARIAKRALGNVKVACSEARWFLDQFVADASVAAIHIYFPDPWWKTKHRKRRLLTAEFAGQCARVLNPGGRLHVVSDVAEYFAQTAQMIEQTKVFQRLPSSDPDAPRHDMDYLTNFERKYSKEGRPIYRGIWAATTNSRY